ncbi:hypothetical protein TWF481_000707 [Arthrobotrys musiformis]|uniref:Uncharacterized protein n=1 Tax=Arthrobotrys musiformis TaxID=47236 RepID=A0AAV9WU36_9PEZI
MCHRNVRRYACWHTVTDNHVFYCRDASKGRCKKFKDNIYLSGRQCHMCQTGYTVSPKQERERLRQREREQGKGKQMQGAEGEREVARTGEGDDLSLFSRSGSKDSG